ncbi:TIM barrel protein [Paenibacillus phytorum]|nr:TIM barrel protein [Paenibacillus phytorum]
MNDKGSLPFLFEISSVPWDYGDLCLPHERKDVVFSKAEWRRSELESFRKHVERLQEMNCKHVIIREVGGSVHWDPTRSNNEKEVVRLTDDQWNFFAEGLHLAGEICQSYNMLLVYQHHIGTVVEKAKEIGKLMEATDPHLVHLMLDTGHAYYGGGDPLALLNHYYERIRFIHLTDIRQSVLNHVREKSLDFVDSVKQGVFTVPGDGWIQFEPIFKKLIDNQFDGRVIVGWDRDWAVVDPSADLSKSKKYVDKILSGYEGRYQRMEG